MASNSLLQEPNSDSNPYFLILIILHQDFHIGTVMWKEVPWPSIRFHQYPPVDIGLDRNNSGNVNICGMALRVISWASGFWCAFNIVNRIFHSRKILLLFSNKIPHLLLNKFVKLKDNFVAFYMITTLLTSTKTHLRALRVEEMEIGDPRSNLGRGYLRFISC